MSGKNAADNLPENRGDKKRLEGSGHGENNSKQPEFSLRRAPILPQEERFSEIFFKLAGFSWRNARQIVQKNQCIRSLNVLHIVSRGRPKDSSNVECIVSTWGGFPYPRNFPSSQPSDYLVTQLTREGPHVTTLETEWESRQPNIPEIETRRARCKVTRVTREKPHVTTLETEWDSKQPSIPEAARCKVTRVTRESPHVTTLETEWESKQPNIPETEIWGCKVNQVTRKCSRFATVEYETEWTPNRPDIQERETQKSGPSSNLDIQETVIQTADGGTRLITQPRPELTDLRTQFESTLTDLQVQSETNLTDLRIKSESTLTSLRTQSEPTLTSLRTEFMSTQVALQDLPSTQTEITYWIHMLGFSSKVRGITEKVKDEEGRGSEREAKGIEKEVSFNTPMFGFTRRSMLRSETRVSPIYIALGIFSKVDDQPREKIVFVQNPKYLFWKIWWAVISLRGLSSFFSLKSIKAFKVYKARRPNHLLVILAYL